MEVRSTRPGARPVRRAAPQRARREAASARARPWIVLAAAAAWLLPAAPAVASPDASPEGWWATRRVERSSCGPLVDDHDHRLVPGAGPPPAPWIDPDAEHDELAEPALYALRRDVFRARERFRLLDGALRVEVRLAPRDGTFDVRIALEGGPRTREAFATYYPGVALPCRASGSLRLHELTYPAADPELGLRRHRLLRRAADAIFHRELAAAHEALDDAQALAPDSALVHWMRSRTLLFEAAELAPGAEEGRMRLLERAVASAERAVALDPGCAEAHLYLAASRGQVVSERGGLGRALAALGPESGPDSLLDSLETAIRLRSRYDYLGDPLHGDALYASAQLHRILPDAFWAGAVVGARGDVDRAVELADRAVSLQRGSIAYQKELGASLLCRAAREDDEDGDADERADLARGRRALEAALALPAFNAEERLHRAHARGLLAGDPEDACDSRPGDAARRRVNGTSQAGIEPATRDLSPLGAPDPSAPSDARDAPGGARAP